MTEFRSPARVAVSHDGALRRFATRALAPTGLAALGIVGLGSALQLGALGAASTIFALGAILAAVGSGLGERSFLAREASGVEVDDAGLTLATPGEPTRIPLARVEAAHLDDDRTARVRLTSGADLTAAFDDPSSARAFVAAFGPEITERAVRFPVRSRGGGVRVRGRDIVGSVRADVGAWAITFFGFVVSWFFAMGTGVAAWEADHLAGSAAPRVLGACLVGVLSLALLAGWTAMVRPRDATVGSDGIVLHGLVRDRFVPYAAIADVLDDERFVRLTLTTGKAIALPIAPGGSGLATRIRERMAGRRRSDEPAERLEALARGGKGAAEWKRDLERAMRDEQGYRGDALSAERLANVVEDASVPVDRRVGAAMMLAAKGDEGDRRRIRIAAVASADADVRAALEEASEGELSEEAVARAERKVQ